MELQVAHDVLNSVVSRRGIMWDKIESFEKLLKENIPCVTHVPGEKRSKEMHEMFPIKEHLDNGMYTREVFMPKGSLVISLIHTQNHPSFFLKGKMSIITDDGEVKTIQAPLHVNTKIGTQRVAYMHEDCVWTCVYKTSAKTFKEAEEDVYTNNYRNLPIELINKNKLLWQQ